MFKINCLNPISNVGTDLFTENYEIVENYADSDAILVRSAAMHDLELPDTVEAIARAGAGVNNIPLDECAKKGIVVFNTPGANANGVKELVIAGLLYAARDIVGGINWVQTVKDDENVAKLVEKNKSKFAGTEILGKKLGVIGLGAIGVKVANAAEELGMEVLGYDPYISVNAAWNLSTNVKHIQSLDDIFTQCDYITIHVPLLDSTKYTINKETIAKMKDGVVVLNFARDLLVNDDDMREALESGKVKRYVTDFPNPKSVNMPNVIATPHLGASTAESEDNCAVMAVKQLMDYIENGNITNSVNYPACSLGVCQKAGRVAINHKNIPNMIGQITSVISACGLNISDMVNKSKGDYAYSLIDVEAPATQELYNKLKEIDGVIKVRIIK